jgi:large subunit ribosomal protein L21
MKYAIVKIGGSQYKVTEGEKIVVDKLATKTKTVEFPEVLLLVDDKKVEIGSPLVKGAKIKANVLEDLKGEKIRVAKYKAKSRYRRVKGFRPSLTKIEINKIIS